MREFLYILFACCIATMCEAAFVDVKHLKQSRMFDLCNVSDKPVYFAIYSSETGGYAIKYSAEYGKPAVLPSQQSKLLMSKNGSSLSGALPFTSVPLPVRRCSAWGASGPNADCRDYFPRVALFSFSFDDIAAAGHKIASLTGDAALTGDVSLNAGHEFDAGKQYYIFWNRDGFDPLYAASSGKTLMNKRNFRSGKLNLIEDTTPLLRDALREYVAFGNWRATKQRKGAV